MQRFESFLRWFLLASLAIIPFLTHEFNEQSPFELPKLVALSFAVIIVTIGFLITQITHKNLTLKWNHMLSVILMLLLVVILSYQKSNYKFFSFWGNNNVPTDGLWAVIICSLLALICTQLFNDRKKIMYLASSILLSHLGLAVYGIVQHFGYDPIDWWGYPDMATAAYATIGQPVAYSTMLGVSIPLAASLFYTQKTALKNWISGAILFVLLLGQLYSGSRTPVFLSIASVLLIAFLGLREFKETKKKFFLILAILFFANFGYFVEGQTAIGEKFKRGAVSTGLSTRAQVWADSIKIWKKYPILGSGPETFAFELKLVNEKDFNTNYHWGLFWHKAHNHFFHFLATLGIVGVLAHFVFVIALLFIFFKFYSSEVKNEIAKEPSWESSRLFGYSILIVPIFIYIANLTAFNFVLTQAYTLLFAAIFLVWRSPEYVHTIQVRFPKFINAINTVFLITILVLFSHQIYQFWAADRYFSMSRKFYEADRNFEMSMNTIDKAIAYKPEDCRHLIRKSMYLSNAYISQRMQKIPFSHSEAVANLKLLTETAVDCNRNAPDTWYFKGQIFLDLYSTGIITSELIAEESLLEARKLNPANPVLTYLLGILYQRAGRLKDFEREMLHAIDLKSDFFVAYGVLTESYFNQKRQTQIDELVQKIQNVKETSRDMLVELPKIIELAKRYNDYGNAKLLQNTYIELSRPLSK